jgi:hypothetical protein
VVWAEYLGWVVVRVSWVVSGSSETRKKLSNRYDDPPGYCESGWKLRLRRWWIHVGLGWWLERQFELDYGNPWVETRAPIDRNKNVKRLNSPFRESLRGRIEIGKFSLTLIHWYNQIYISYQYSRIFQGLWIRWHLSLITENNISRGHLSLQKNKNQQLLFFKKILLTANDWGLIFSWLFLSSCVLFSPDIVWASVCFFWACLFQYHYWDLLLAAYHGMCAVVN